jgi:hypothetical protein
MQLENYNFTGKEDFKNLWMTTVTNEYGLFRGRENELGEIFETLFDNTDVELFNSHKNKTTVMPMIDFVNQVYEDKVIMIEHGVMFSAKPEDMSPAVMTEDYLKKQRKIVKKEANYNLTEGDKVKGKIQNIMQDNIKLIMNTFYGIMNNAYSKFYNKDLGGSITCKSRHTISLNGLACEAFMGYYRFRNVGAIKHMIKEINSSGSAEGIQLFTEESYQRFCTAEERRVHSC